MIHGDFNTHSTNETTRDEPKLLGIFRCAGKRAFDKISEKVIVNPREKFTISPNKTNHLFPSNYYSQFKVWCGYMLITPSEQSYDNNVDQNI